MSVDKEKRSLVWVATHLVTYGEESDEKEMKEKIQKKVYQQRYGLFTDFSVARQSRIYGFAPSSRLELEKNSTSHKCQSVWRTTQEQRRIGGKWAPNGRIGRIQLTENSEMGSAE